jgi:hypothetical protein
MQPKELGLGAENHSEPRLFLLLLQVEAGNAVLLNAARKTISQSAPSGSTT